MKRMSRSMRLERSRNARLWITSVLVPGVMLYFGNEKVKNAVDTAVEAVTDKGGDIIMDAKKKLQLELGKKKNEDMVLKLYNEEHMEPSRIAEITKVPESVVRRICSK